jgi:hypothetical protein
MRRHRHENQYERFPEISRKKAGSSGQQQGQDGNSDQAVRYSPVIFEISRCSADGRKDVHVRKVRCDDRRHSRVTNAFISARSRDGQAYESVGRVEH